MKNTFSSIVVAVCFLLVGCNSHSGFDEKDGLFYTFLKNEPGKPIQKGTFVKFGLRYGTEDSSYFDGIQNKDTAILQIKDPLFEGDLHQALLLMSPGDHAKFHINSKKFYHYQLEADLPPSLLKTKFLTVEIVLYGSIDGDDVSLELAKLNQHRMLREEQMMKELMKGEYLQYSKDEEGYYFAIIDSGIGNSPQPGDTVSIRYQGMFLNGAVFDQTEESDEDLSFVYGNGEMIQGVEKGLRHLKQGGKMKLLLPSYLAYGSAGKGEIIPPNSPLYFVIERTR